MAANPLPLDDLLDNGFVPPLSSKPLRPLEKPAYSRAGLYGDTPFKTLEAAIIALISEQHCRSCGVITRCFGGIFAERTGRDGIGSVTLKTAIHNIPREQITEVRVGVEDVEYCQACL